MSTATLDAKKHFHIGIRKDEKRGTPPLAFFQVPSAQVCFQYRTGIYDEEARVEVPRAGQLVSLTQAQIFALAKALKGMAVSRTPCEVIRTVEHVRTSPDNPKLVDKPVTVDYSPHGRGRIVQWLVVKDDKGEKVVGWDARILDLSDREYQPLEDLENEVPLVEYLYMVEKDEGPKFEPPALNLSDLEEQATKIEEQEQAADPEGFARTQEAHRRVKKAGMKASDLPPQG